MLQRMRIVKEGRGGSSAQLPEGWADRHTAVSADELMRRGIIAPDEPLGDLK